MKTTGNIKTFEEVMNFNGCIVAEFDKEDFYNVVASEKNYYAQFLVQNIGNYKFIVRTIYVQGDQAKACEQEIQLFDLLNGRNKEI